MKTKLFRIIVALLLALTAMFAFAGCDKADTTRHNIQQEADNFNVYRKMTFVNLYSADLKHCKSCHKDR